MQLQLVQPAPGDAERIEALTYGVSVGGAFIETDWLPPPRAILDVWLRPTVPGARPPVLRLRAEVRWVSDGRRRDVPRGFGVAFCAVTCADELALHGYVSAAYKVV